MSSDSSAVPTDPAVVENTCSNSSATTEEAPRRVVLNPTGANDFKAVGTIDPAKAERHAERDIDAEAEREARPARDLPSRPEPSSVEVPDVVELDAAMEAEINAAMGGETAANTAVATAAAVELPSEETLEQGKRLTGKVVVVHGEDLFLDLGFRSQGVLPLKQFEGKEVPAVGASVTVVVHKVSPEEGLIHVSLPTGRQKVSGNWDAVQVGQIVDCMVTKTNKGGLEVTVSSLRGFLPSGQVDLRYVENLEQFVGQKLTVKVTEVNKARRNLIVSRRAVLLEERAQAEERILSSLEVGQTLDGTVKSIKDYGAFIDIGGIDGFVHIGQLSWQHVRHPSEVVTEGQAVKVKVISISDDKKKIGLSIKQTSQSPWDLAASKYFQGQTVSGTVTRTTDFGAFVRLEPGVEGMIHISELDHKRVARVADVVTVGQTVEAQVQSVDAVKHRIGLSLKALKARPEPAAPAESETSPVPGPPPARKTPLKGGREDVAPRSGGLFGNPSDYK